ncbi:hypothetical protein RhiirA1_427045, partial [Rhizophagus irregularis]
SVKKKTSTIIIKIYIQEIQPSCLHTQIHELATSPSTSSPSRVYSSQPEELCQQVHIKQDAADGVDDEARNL